MKRSKWKPLCFTKLPERNRAVTVEMIGSTVSISNGKSSRAVKITADHLNYNLGAFSHTKVTPRFKQKRKQI